MSSTHQTSPPRTDAQPETAGELIELSQMNTQTDGSNRPDTGLDPNSDQPDLPQPNNLEPRPLGRFTPLQISILVAGPLVSFGVLGFLAFLWIQSYMAQDGQTIQPTWYKMLDSGWVLRAIPVVSAVLRTATSMEAGLATSMVAALLLERPGVRVSRLADVAVLRSVDSPPHVLAWRALHDLLTPPLHVSRYFLFLLLITTLVTQLSSTILLLDFTDTTIPRVLLPADARIPFAHSAARGPTYYVGTNQAAFFHSAAQFPRFAEFSQPPLQPDTTIQERKFRDTGAVYRAFLPLRKDDRQILRQYAGPATVLNSRVVCVRPTISRFAISSPQIPFYSQLLLANLTFSLDTPARLRTINIFSDEFVEHAKRPTNVSVPVIKDTSLSDTGSPQGQNEDKQWSMSVTKSRYPGGASTYLLFNWTGSTDNWGEDDLAFEESWVGRNREEWVAISHRARELSVDITVCLTWFNSTPYLISTEAGKAEVEPEVGWDGASGMLTKARAAKHLGAPDKGRDGILSMQALPPTSEIPKSNTTFETKDIGSTITGQVTLAMEVMKLKLATLDPSKIIFANSRWVADLCYGTDLDGFFGLHSSFTAVFQEIIQGTRNPAVAVQSLLTMASANAYVELQQYFDYEMPVRYSTWSPALVPTRWSGLILLTAVVVLHVLAAVMVTVLFVGETRCSELGNSWQAVAQLVTEDTRPILLDACRDRGDVFKERVRKDGGDIRYRIVWQEDVPRLARV
ncbi:hypothetical protein B0T18DRAFT_394403 [Schizothecium vesticola]|uniref:Uncharacterized protein n=1 Tax=Schizothecium vesticola TaxID=314040 RepID=A0AA40BPH4_9PEZI|nr:hypothetical protein B0T18DRAFT_394403 [Schizothecium vesticola]